FRSVKKEIDSPKVKKLFLKPPFFKVAAVIVFFLIPIGGYLHHVFFKEKVLISAQDIKPGEQKALLILSDGSKVVLDGRSQEQVLTVEGAEIERKDGQLVYTGTKGKKHTVPLYHTIQIPQGGVYELSLPDGTKV